MEKEFDANGLTFEQLFLDGKAGLELAYDKQEYDLVDTFAIPRNRWNMVWIDINETLGNGSPNPNVGRPMMIAQRDTGVPQNTRETERESTRATAFYELDFQDREDALGWLGKHTFTGLLQSDTVDRESLNTELKWGPYQTYSDLHNGSRRRGAAAALVRRSGLAEYCQLPRRSARYAYHREVASGWR